MGEQSDKVALGCVGGCEGGGRCRMCQEHQVRAFSAWPDSTTVDDPSLNFNTVIVPKTCLTYRLPSISSISPNDSARTYLVVLLNLRGALPSMFIALHDHTRLPTVAMLHLSTSSMTIRLSPYFVYIARASWTKRKPTTIASSRGENGAVNAGGTSLCTSVEDGDLSSLNPHPTSVYPSFVHTERRWQTCWHVHLPFLSSSITPTRVGVSL